MKKIESFNSLKAIMLLILFYWHSPIPRYGLGDLGARTCEFLFVISGFCVAYNWEKKYIRFFFLCNEICKGKMV